MCLILFSYRQTPGLELLLLANRDELFNRPSTQASFWKEHPDILGGRDLVQGGSWLAVNTSGRFAAVTNFRNPADMTPKGMSRGSLVSEFLLGREAAFSFADSRNHSNVEYNGYNLLAFDGTDLVWGSNRSAGSPLRILPGIHGVSNHLLNTPWPKVRIGKERLASLLEKPQVNVQERIPEFLELMGDTSRFPVQELPDTGVGVKMEQFLSPMRIIGNDYGTRCTTIVWVTTSGQLGLVEKTYLADGSTLDQVRFLIDLQ